MPASGAFPHPTSLACSRHTLADGRFVSAFRALRDVSVFPRSWSRTSMSTWPSPSSEQLGTPDPPAIRFTRGPSFGPSWFTHLLRPVRLLALLYGSDRYARPPRAFTSRVPTERNIVVRRRDDADDALRSGPKHAGA